MKLLENDITAILVSNYNVSIGYVGSVTDINIDVLNEGILETHPITVNKVSRASEIKTWITGTIYAKNSFRIADNRVYVCLYSPGTNSIIEPSGNLQSNTILDDNYVWRYMCEVQEVYHADYVLPDLDIPEIVRKGCISGVSIVDKTENQISEFSNFYLDTSLVSGSGVTFVVENDQSNFTVSDVLIQNGGSGYKREDFILITDTQHLQADTAVINLTVNLDGTLSIPSYTNGQNYDYVDIKIIGDGSGAEVTYNVIGGVITGLNLSDVGTGYTWAKAIVVNSENYIIGIPDIEPLNGYNADLLRHIGPNKYIIETEVLSKQEINYYGIHRKETDPEKYVYFDNIYFIEEFVPMEEETVKLKLILGMS